MLHDASELTKAMKRAALDVLEASKPVNVCFGQVVSKSPLKINVEQKMVLGQNQLILSRNVTDFKTLVTVQWETEKKNGGSGDSSFASHTHDIVGEKEITIHNALEVGDEVILIRQQKGQKYVVIDRIGVI